MLCGIQRFSAEQVLAPRNDFILRGIRTVLREMLYSPRNSYISVGRVGLADLNVWNTVYL